MMIPICSKCGEEGFSAIQGETCGRDLSEELGLPVGTVLCDGTYWFCGREPVVRSPYYYRYTEELPGVTTADPEESFSGVSSNLRRTGLMGILLACTLALSGIAHAADPVPTQPKAPRAKPISSITVRVQPAAKMDGKPWRITTVDQDSCVAWVSTTAPNLEQAELQAFRECRKAINLAVDTAHGKAEQGQGQR